MAGGTAAGRRRGGRILLGLAALFGLAALLVAVPLVLLAAWRHLGPPVPTWQELTGPDNGTLFVRVLCLVGWVGWVTFAWSVLAEFLAQILGWRVPALRWQRRMAAGLVAAVLVMLSSPAIASGTATPVRAAPAVSVPTLQPLAAPGGAVTMTAAPVAVAAYTEHLVQPGEQMSALAERYLGDKYQWHAIAAATYGIEQPDGRTLRQGDTRIYPGWTVRIPTHNAGNGRIPVALAPAGPTYQRAFCEVFVVRHRSMK